MLLAQARLAVSLQTIMFAGVLIEFIRGFGLSTSTASFLRNNVRLCGKCLGASFSVLQAPGIKNPLRVPEFSKNFTFEMEET